MFTFEHPVRHDAGQHYEIRLTGEDGYQAARLYSAAMPANGTGNTLQLTIALMPGGEVSSYIFAQVKPGSLLEIRGPLGGYFRWDPTITKPVLLVGGGAGVIPLRAIRLAHQQACSKAQIKLLYSMRNYSDMAYKYELFPSLGKPPQDVVMTFTKEAPAHWSGYARRIDAGMIEDVLSTYRDAPLAYVCGSAPMVEAVADLLVATGLDPATIKTERFGSTA
jgi:ferredoxin-NADP reductase